MFLPGLERACYSSANDSTGGEIAVGDMLQADVDALHALSATLSGIADAITGIAIDGSVTMPGSPVSAITDTCRSAVENAYGQLQAAETG
ncbi:hypothetical protein DW322_15265 [Rhodococcus rhodnii]|uniref:Uncharacterized protein n=2 Tax=Rhodococcus rhodnii TaxID=38312 RepID=R7WWL0_9NOCA|nr:hypothetical protein [Rhodococcus rhodnii]EOM78529.1 hypothetical protein Rrhod_0066 [Rhodococcus rhodnii LMG 5362]TXG91318.1 hypothetical protein DW322_15265 [Rhodococcus rhodnii]